MSYYKPIVELQEWKLKKFSNGEFLNFLIFQFLFYFFNGFVSFFFFW